MIPLQRTLDLILRLRSWLSDLERAEADRRVLVVAHDAVILLIRYVCENLNEAEVLDIGRTVSVANTSVTRLVRADGAAAWTLDLFNAQQHLTEHGSQPTEHPAEHDVEPH